MTLTKIFSKRLKKRGQNSNMHNKKAEKGKIAKNGKKY